MTRRLSNHFFALLVFIIGIGAVRADYSPSEKTSNPVDTQSPIQLTLQQAIELALKANRGVVVADDAVAFSRLSLDSAESDFEVKFIPALDAATTDGGTGTETGVGLEGAVEKKFVLGPTGAVVPRTGYSDDGEYTTGVGIQLDIPLFRGFGRPVNLDAVDTARFNLRRSRYNYELTRDRTVLDTVAAVYAVRQQERLLDLFSAQIDRYRGHAAAARVKERAGLASPIDVYRAEIRSKDAEDSLSRTRKALADARDRLKLVLTIPLEMSIQVGAPDMVEPVTLEPDAALDIALENRVELKRAQDGLNDALRRSRIARQGLRPDVNLVLDYERTGSADDFGQSTRLEQDNWRVGLFGSTTFPRSAEKASFQQSLLTIRTARMNAAQVRDDIGREVRAQLSALQEAENSIRIREAQQDTAEGKLALSVIKFRYDMADNFDVIESESELERATIDLLTAKTDYIVGVYRLRSVLGTLVE